MAEQPSKSDITSIFKRLRSIPTNKQCFDCNHSNPTWASVTYGVFLCIDCSAVHRSLGVHISFIRSTQLDTNWTWLQLRAMQVGGNANAYAFFRQHGCDSADAQKKYHSRAAHLYREKLLTHTQNALRLYGTKLHIDVAKEPTSPTTDKDDFFEEHTKIEDVSVTESVSDEAKLSASKPIKNGSTNGPKNDIDPSEGPKVDHALSISPTEAAAAAEPRKTLIGAKKIGAAKKGKTGFGAQRVKTNFNEIENRAQQLDKERENLAKMSDVQEAKTTEEQEKQMTSMRLAYKDMSLERKKQEEKLLAADPKKAEQFERLGMGFAGNKGISHSAISDMQTIEQESINDDRGGGQYGRKTNKWSREKDFFEDEMEMFGGGFSKGYGDGSFGSKKDPYGDSSYGSKNDDYGSWGNANKGGSWDIDRFETKQSKSETITSKQDDSIPEAMESEVDWPSRSRKTYDTSSSTEAQQRFGSAKAISSDTYFGNKDPDFETRQTLSRLEGKSGISSDDVFGSDKPKRSDSYTNTPDLQDIKDGVREGVTKVAGKLSSLANGVMNSLQDRYGS